MTRAELLLTDVTEMSGDSVCIAGIDLADDRCVRFADPTPTRAQLRRWGGLAPGEVLNIEYEFLRRPTPPHLEDARWKPESLRKLHAVPQDLRDAARRLAFESVESAFGDTWFRSGNRSAAWRPESGERSLAFVRARYVRAVTGAGGGLRLAFRDDGDAYYGSVPFQDLRVKSHRGRCAECDGNVLKLAQAELDANSCVVRVGLTRPFAQEHYETACWLQVNHLPHWQPSHFGSVIQ